jgi:hypothetical protein
MLAEISSSAHHSEQDPILTTESLEAATNDPQDEEGSEQSFKQWLSLFPEHAIPFVFREAMY